MTTDRGRSIIFYPRSYNTRGETKKHSMLGVTESGKSINVKLRLDEKHEGKENAPSIKEFAKTDYLAKNPCIASDDNSAENPEGVLLLSRCIKDTFDNDKGVEVYIARWAVVLSPSSQTPPLHKGLGRMEIKKDSSTVKKLSGLLRKAEADNRLDDADTLKSQIEDPVNWSYPAIFYYPEEMVTFSLDNSKAVEEKATSALERLSKSGIVSGLAVRARNRSNEVVKETYKEIFAKFIISETRYQNGKETFESITKELAEKYKNDDFKWDAIPIKKINTGPSSSRFYGKNDKISFTRAMFTYDGCDSEPRLSKICARVSYFGDTDNTLLSRLYTLSEPLEHPARLDKSGHFSLTFTGEGTKLAHLPVDDESIVQIKDGLSEDFNLIKRAFWLLEGNAPIIRLEDQSEDKGNLGIFSDEGSENETHKEEEDKPGNSQIIEERPLKIDDKEPEDISGSSGEDENGKDDQEEAPEEKDLSDEDDEFFELTEVETEIENIEQKTFEDRVIENQIEDENEKDTSLEPDVVNREDDAPCEEIEDESPEEQSSMKIEPDSAYTLENIWPEKDHQKDQVLKEKPEENSGALKKEKRLTGMAASLFNKK